MKIKQLILTCCSLLFILTSCNNYLDVKPKGKIIPKTAEEYSTILHYWLDEIEKGANATIIPEPDYTSLLEFFAEDLDGTLASSLVNTQLYVGSRINTNQKRYPELYSVIKDCNVIISNMEDTESEMAKNILGTAWSLRSICYYNLLQSFCEPYQPETATETLGLPLVDEFDMEAKPERSNQKETAEFRKLAGDSLLNSKEETIKNIQNTTLSDIYSYYSEILKNTEAQYTVTIDKSFIDDNKNLFYSTLNSGMSNKFQKQSDKVLSSLEAITNKENLRFYDNDNDAYITFHYPVKIDSDRERLIYRYLTLLEIFWRVPYVSEDSGGKKYSLPMELNSNDITSNKYGFLEFKFVPKGNEKIDSTDDAIEVFKAVLGILYGEKLAPNTLESIKDYEKELYNERLNKNFDDERTHEILKNYRKNVFKIYELIDDIDFEDIKWSIEYILFEQNPIVIINEKINPYEVKGQTVDNNIINC